VSIELRGELKRHIAAKHKLARESLCEIASVATIRG